MNKNIQGDFRIYVSVPLTNSFLLCLFSLQNRKVRVNFYKTMNSMHFSRNVNRINFLLIILDQANANTTPSAVDVEVTEIYSSAPPQNVVSSDPSTSTSQDQQNNVTTVQKPKLTRKQDELNKMVNIENEILVSLCISEIKLRTRI